MASPNLAPQRHLLPVLGVLTSLAGRTEGSSGLEVDFDAEVGPFDGLGAVRLEVDVVLVGPLPYDVGEGAGSRRSAASGPWLRASTVSASCVAVDGVSLGPLFPGVEGVDSGLGVAESFRVVVPAVQHVVRAEGVAGSGEVSLRLASFPVGGFGLFVGVGEFLFGATEAFVGGGEVGASGAAVT